MPSIPVQVPSPVLDRYRAYLGPHDDVSDRVTQLIEREMYSEGGGRDGLTGCGSRSSLVQYVNSRVLASGDRAARFSEHLLCCDIENFVRFVNHNGFGPSDDVLIRLAGRLMELTSKDAVYRFGGDEFVVWGIGSPIADLGKDLGVNVKQSIVEVDVGVDRERHHRVTSWIMLHVHRGVVESSVSGVRLTCTDRPEWTAE